jgi:hypothetical protein
MMSTRRAERLVVGLGALLIVGLVTLAASGIYLKSFYHPVSASAWSDIRTLHTDISVGLIIRNVHRWISRLVAVGLPIFFVVYAFAGTRNRAIHRRRHWIAALIAIGLGLVGPTVVVWSVPIRVPQRSWHLVHELPAYLLIVAVVFALAVRPRVQETEPPRSPPTPPDETASTARVDDAQRPARPEGVQAHGH